MNYERIHQRVTVSATFPEAGQPLVHSFVWEGRYYKVNKVHMVNSMYKGRDQVFMFSLAAATGAYKLRLDTATLDWWLEEIYWETY